jgi:hypothetical protein
MKIFILFFLLLLSYSSSTLNIINIYDKVLNVQDSSNDSFKELQELIGLVFE